MQVDDAFALISRAVDSGHAANGYLVCGDMRGQCDRLVGLVLAKLFPDAAEQIAARSHPDVLWLEPQGKSRTIKVERAKDDDGPGMRDGIVEPMSVTSFSGGWKVGVIAGADRMQPAAANAFLKTLEEPPPKTMFLLLTDAPDSILPTIVSRTQRIDLPLSEGVLEGDDYAAVAEVMGAAIPQGAYEKAQAGKRLAEILGELKDAAEPEDVALVRKAFYKTVMSFVRRWMVEGRLPTWQAFRNVEAVEDAYRQSERAMSDDSVLCFMTDRMVFPK
jgi:DNA polymerase-3 subunit delta'